MLNRRVKLEFNKETSGSQPITMEYCPNLHIPFAQRKKPLHHISRVSTSKPKPDSESYPASHHHLLYSYPTYSNVKVIMSQANQPSIATLFGGQTDQSALEGPLDQEVGSVSASFTLPIRPSARTPAGAQTNHTIAGDTSGETATEGAPNHLQTKPLFQSFGRHSPTETELKTAEEIEYDDMARVWHELEEAHKSAVPTSSPPLIQESVFDNECWEISAGEFMASQAISSRDAPVDSMITDEEIERFEDENGVGEMTEEEMWAIFNDCDEQEDEKENLAPFNGLVRRKTA